MNTEPRNPIAVSLKPRSFLTSEMTPLKIPRSTESMNATAARRTTGPRP
jgi:hypothetical protein